MKKLKLRIAKFDRMLVVEQLEIHGDWVASEHVKVFSRVMGIFASEIFFSPEKAETFKCGTETFGNNQERDEYAASLVKWITEEQFGGSGKLEIGKPCLVCDDGMDWKRRIFAGKAAKKLGIDKRFLAVSELEIDGLCRWRYAKPLNSTQPKIDGEIYTWEIGE